MEVKRLVTKDEAEKKKGRNRFLVGAVLVFIMVGSTIGFTLQGRLGTTESQGGEDKLTYNGFEFVNRNGFWVVGSLVFTYNPNQIPAGQKISNLKLVEGYSGKPLYLNSPKGEVENEIYLNTINFAERIQPACIQGETCSEGLPVKTCTDNLIIIREGNTSNIRQEENCVYIEGQSDELLKLTDEFLFRIFGIKE